MWVCAGDKIWVQPVLVKDATGKPKDEPHATLNLSEVAYRRDSRIEIIISGDESAGKEVNVNNCKSSRSSRGFDLLADALQGLGLTDKGASLEDALADVVSQGKWLDVEQALLRLLK
eukprot:scaffold195900_cov43-Prasinocladus_malaysianus.AAC.1